MLRLTPQEIFGYCHYSADGFSAHVDSGLHPTSGYMVSLPQCETVSKARPSMATCRVYYGRLRRVCELRELQGHGLERLYVGGWLDEQTGDYYLDASWNFADKQTALAAAEEWNQKAIYDVAAEECVYLESSTVAN